jgi:hypothetical protein
MIQILGESIQDYMSIFKNNPDFKLYYSDTDSAVIDKALPVLGAPLSPLLFALASRGPSGVESRPGNSWW